MTNGGATHCPTLSSSSLTDASAEQKGVCVGAVSSPAFTAVNHDGKSSERYLAAVSQPWGLKLPRRVKKQRLREKRPDVESNELGAKASVRSHLSRLASFFFFLDQKIASV